MNEDKHVEKHINFLVGSFGQQVAAGRLRRFVFPQPANNIERKALSLFISTLEKKIGLPVQIALTRGSRLMIVLPPHWETSNDVR